MVLPIVHVIAVTGLAPASSFTQSREIQVNGNLKGPMEKDFYNSIAWYRTPLRTAFNLVFFFSFYMSKLLAFVSLHISIFMSKAVTSFRASTTIACVQSLQEVSFDFP